MSQQEQSSAESETETPEAKPEVLVIDTPERHRFEIRVGGDLAGFTVYRPEGDRYAFTHTEIEPGFSGGGLASILVRGALDEMRHRGTAVLPYCPFVRRYISRHLDYLDLVPSGARAEFDLPAG